jgi:hypothetical protein
MDDDHIYAPWLPYNTHQKNCLAYCYLILVDVYTRMILNRTSSIEFAHRASLRQASTQGH